jgi:anti-sigma B factor antagonist
MGHLVSLSAASIAEGGTLVTAAGEVDLSNASILADYLCDYGTTGDVVLDMAQITYLDSQGIHALLRVSRHVEKASHQLRLRSVPDRLRRVFELSGVDQMLTFDDQARTDEH